jgi:hypothetical protein
VRDAGHAGNDFMTACAIPPEASGSVTRDADSSKMLPLVRLVNAPVDALASQICGKIRRAVDRRASYR